MRKIALTFALLLASGAAFAQDDSALLNFVVLRDYNGKPIRNASVVMHPVNKDGKQAKGGLQIKTDAEGKASFDGAPYGKLRVQVLAPGFQTFGADCQDEAARGAVLHLRGTSGGKEGREKRVAGFEAKAVAGDFRL